MTCIKNTCPVSATTACTFSSSWEKGPSSACSEWYDNQPAWHETSRKRSLAHDLAAWQPSKSDLDANKFPPAVRCFLAGRFGGIGRFDTVFAKFSTFDDSCGGGLSLICHYISGPFLQLSILLKSAALGPIRHKIRFDCMIAPSHGVPTTSKTDSNLFKP